MLKSKFPHYSQLETEDCGPTCLKIVAKFYGKSISSRSLREVSYISKNGTNLLSIADAAEKIGLRTMGVRISYEKLLNKGVFPCIAYWQQKHFFVVYKITKKYVYVSDPAVSNGLVKFSKEEFCSGWCNDTENGEQKGICLFLHPTPKFHELNDEEIDKTINHFSFLITYIRPYRKLFRQIAYGLLAGIIIQMILPFMTQWIVDFGIGGHNLSFIYIILIAQIVLFTGKCFVEFFRGWLLLHISARINISLLSDFLQKLLKLPMNFFDTKNKGDIYQRIQDHHRVEEFLTSQTLNVIFSTFYFLVFGGILFIYNKEIFAIFLAGTIIYVLWVLSFQKRRQRVDYKRFALMSRHQCNLFEMIDGVQEIKLNNAQKQKRWEWEEIQAKIFHNSITGLTIEQWQNIGSVFINETKNIIISFLAAKAVFQNIMTLGEMLSIQFIIGQLNSPIGQVISFIHSLQDARMSLERLSEIHQEEGEDTNQEICMKLLPNEKTIKLRNVSFVYGNPSSTRGKVLSNINLTIPENKVTAIVGASGSGKTTILKLLLGFYNPNVGEISIGGLPLCNYDINVWRNSCATVMQDGYIFSDSIAKNIAVNIENLDVERLLQSTKIANISNYIDSLPQRYNNRIGSDGDGLSQGQKQRILIARAIYKNTPYLFLDEATSSLDAKNETNIMKEFEKIKKGKTVVIVAHRLSTVKNADNIVVLDKGRIVEEGNFDLLVNKKGFFFDLVESQLNSNILQYEI